MARTLDKPLHLGGDWQLDPVAARSTPEIALHPIKNPAGIKDLSIMYYTLHIICYVLHMVCYVVCDVLSYITYVRASWPAGISCLRELVQPSATAGLDLASLLLHLSMSEPLSVASMRFSSVKCYNASGSIACPVYQRKMASLSWMGC